MQRFRLGAALLMMFLAGAAAHALAGEVIEKPEFTLTLPDGWTEFSPETLKRFNANVAAASRSGKPTRYAYGFQRKGTSKWLELPYIVVTVNTAGRWPESMLKELKTTDMTKLLREKLRGNAKTLGDFSIGTPMYDETAHIVWITGEMTVEGHGRIKVLSGLIPTQTGYVQITGDAPKAAFSTYMPLFSQVILSITIPKDMRY